MERQQPLPTSNSSSFNTKREEDLAKRRVRASNRRRKASAAKDKRDKENEKHRARKQNAREEEREQKIKALKKREGNRLRQAKSRNNQKEAMREASDQIGDLPSFVGAPQRPRQPLSNDNKENSRSSGSMMPPEEVMETPHVLSGKHVAAITPLQQTRFAKKESARRVRAFQFESENADEAVMSAVDDALVHAMHVSRKDMERR